ncbi:MAG: hypothetical protein IKF91_02935 [Bacilli bacterium]|nr:hypothetical protein [Bacilli bacterium]
MKKIILITIIILLIGLSGYKLYQEYRIKHAKIKVDLIDNLDIEVYSDIKLKDLIKNINGKIIKNKAINTKKLGKKEIKFKYINEENIKVNYTFEINIVDNTKPLIKGPNNITLYQNSNVDINKKFTCGDNYDDEPICEIKGTYDKNKIGSYYLQYIAKDNSKNENKQDIILNIIENKDTKSNISEENTNTYFQDIIKKYKENNNKIGIDVSKWQGDIDFKKLKKEKVEFAFIRVGVQTEINGEYYLDTKFKQNIEGFNKEKIPVGVYFYSKATSKKEAKNQAQWIIKQIKKYKIDLPIVFDWEKWDNYRNYNISFFHLSQMYKEFEKEINKKEYESMLYSSKNYLEKVWYTKDKNIWLAHYTDKTNYKGKYKVWQICDDGIIDGIEDKHVDIDIMYE